MYKPEDFASAGNASVESVLTLANVAFAGAERLAALNLNTARSLHEDNMAAVKALLAVKNVEEFGALQASLTQPAAEKALAYSRSAYEICVDAAEQFAKLSAARYEEVAKEVSVAVDKAAKSAPAGSEPAIAAFKSALAAANSAYETVTKTAKQVAEVAEANVAAINDAAVKAVGSSAVAPKSKKAA